MSGENHGCGGVVACHVMGAIRRLLELTQRMVETIQSAAKHMSGHRRRAFQAEVALQYCAGSARRAESIFGWGRDAVATGLDEARTGTLHEDRVSERGRSKSEEIHPELVAVIHSLVAPQTQADPKFQSPLAFTRMTARAVREQLLAHDATHAIHEAHGRLFRSPSTDCGTGLLSSVSQQIQSSRAMWGHLGESWERNLVEFDRAYSGLGSFDDLARCPTDRSTVTANLRNGSEHHQASVCLCGGSSPTVSRTSTWECDHRTPAGVDRSHTLAFTGSTPSSLREPC